MRKSVAVYLSLLVLSAPGAAASELRSAADARHPPLMRVHGQALPPIGYVHFCDRNPFDCEPSGSEPTRFELNTRLLTELDLINRKVNREIEPATDRELYGVEEHWTYPDARRRGDCEDYVLLKRRLLVARGWPQSALLITVVMDERNEGHAILTVRTAQGDFVLDNKNDDIKPWFRTPYRFVMRQSFLHPRIWVSLEPKELKPMPVAGVRSPR